MTVVCEVCGANRQVWPSLAKAKPPRACSKACMDELRRRLRGPGHPLAKSPAIVICKTCKAPFTTKPSLAHRAKFCSRHCHGAWRAAQNPRVSSIERAVAAELDRRGLRYRSQVRIGRFVVDFVCIGTAIEVDGTYWHQLPQVIERDQRKNEFLAANAVPLIRIPEADVRRCDFSALDRIGALSTY